MHEAPLLAKSFFHHLLGMGIISLPPLVVFLKIINSVGLNIFLCLLKTALCQIDKRVVDF